MLTMNYQDLQYRYSKQKKKKQSQLKDEKYKLTKGNFSASTWKDYKEWIKEQKLKEKPSKPKKKKKSIITKAKGQNAVKGLKKALTRKEQYYQELKDKRWKDKSLQIMKRDGFKCALCGSKHNLQVHHIEYIKGKKAWEHPTSVLITLCEDCHKKVHSDPQHDLNPYKKLIK